LWTIRTLGMIYFHFKHIECSEMKNNDKKSKTQPSTIVFFGYGESS